MADLYSDVDTDSVSAGALSAVAEDREVYRDAITKLTPEIVAVLQNEATSIFSKAYAAELIGEDFYTKSLNSQDPSVEIGKLLLTVKDKIKVKISSYDKFSGILKDSAATKHIAKLIEKKVEQLSQGRKVKKVKKKGRGDSSGLGKDKGGKAWGVPDSFEGNSSGISSDLSITQTGDSVEPSKSLSSGSMPMPMGSASYVRENPRNEQDTAEVVSTTPDQEPTAESEPINHGMGSSHDQLVFSNLSIPVYTQLCYVGKVFEKIHHEVESGKTKVKEAFADREDVIYNLQQQLQVMHTVIQKLKEEIGKKVREFKELEIKQEEIDSLKKQFEQDIKELKATHRVENQQRIEQLEQELDRKEKELLANIEQRSEALEALKQAHETEIKDVEDQHRESIGEVNNELKMETQKTKKLEEDLQKAKDEKDALEKQKSEADLKLAQLRVQYSEDIAAIKEKMCNVKLEAQEKVFDAKMEAQKATMQTRLDAQSAIHKAESKTQVQLALQEQAQMFARRVCVAQQATSSSGGSVIHEDCLSISLMQMSLSVTRTSSNGDQSESSSMQRTPSEKEHDHEP